jgi:uncharacterized protein YciI
MFAVHYTYDDRAAERDAVRPQHRAFLENLADAGVALAYARYEDAGLPGALLIFTGESADAIESLLDDDPYALAGLIVAREVRIWNANGPLVAGFAAPA